MAIGFGKYLVMLTLAGFALGRILRFQAIEDFKTPIILKIVGGFSYEFVTLVLLVLLFQAFISCAYILTFSFVSASAVRYQDRLSLLKANCFIQYKVISL